jgi:hypothetical protein
MKHGAYICVKGSKYTDPVTNKAKAIQFAKQNPGTRVMRVSRDWFNGGGMFGYDLPTFLASATQVYPATD